MTNPYQQFQDTSLWFLIEQIVSELERNDDLQCKTNKHLIVGYFCQQLTDRQWENLPVTESPDDVCVAGIEQEIKLTTQLLDKDTVKIEGTQKALDFLGKLLITQARFQTDCGFGIGPTIAGKKLFDQQAKLNLYLHRTPCQHKQET